MDAVGADDQIVFAGAAICKFHFNLVVGLRKLRHRDTQMKPHSGFLRRRKEYVMQRRPCEAEISWIFGPREFHARRITHHIAVSITKSHALIGKSGRNAIVGNTERHHGPDKVALSNDANVVDGPLLLDFDDFNVDSSFTQANGQTADSASDDENFVGPGHMLSETSSRHSRTRIQTQ